MSQTPELRIIYYDTGLPREISSEIRRKNAATWEETTLRGVFHSITVKGAVVSAKIVFRCFVETKSATTRKPSGFFARFMKRESDSATEVIEVVDRWSCVGEDLVGIDFCGEYKRFLLDTMKRKGIAVLDTTISTVFDPIHARLFYELRKKKK